MKSERGLLQTIKVVLLAAISTVLLNIIVELISSAADETTLGKFIGRFGLIVATVVVPACALIWLGLHLRDRRKVPVTRLPERVRPSLPAWQSPPRLHGRESEVDQAVNSLRNNGIALVVGPRDIGTSAVASAAVEWLIHNRGADRARTTRIDLRSQSSRRPDDARAAAGRVVSAFGLDEPADDSPELLADAGRRLLEFLRRGTYDVLMLDNASIPEEVEWLVGQDWPADERPWLVIAGESAIGRAVASDSALVRVGELGLPGLRAMWEEAFAQSNGDAQAEELTAEELDQLLRTSMGRPNVLVAFIREIRRPGSTVTPRSLLRAADSAESADVLVRAWTDMLEHVRDGLSENGVRLLYSLAELPVTGLKRDAIEAMLSGHPDRPENPAPLEQLLERNLVEETEGRYRLPSDIRGAVKATTRVRDRRVHAMTSLPALLGYYAREATRRAAELGSSAEAVDWFHDAERSLRPLFDIESYPGATLIERVIDDLARIADALEAWYVREQQSTGLLAVNEVLHTLAERANRPELAGVAALRMAAAHRIARDFGQASSSLVVAADHRRHVTPDRAAVLAAREQVERMLLDLADGGEPVRLAETETRSRELMAAGPHGPAAVALLINLGALCLRLGRGEDAVEHLRRAADLANERGDIGSYAHAVELHGVALSCAGGEGDLLEAADLWSVAMNKFGTVDEEQGVARCLQHLGSAALTDSRVAGQIRDGWPRVLGRREAAEVALPLLERAKELRSGQPDNRIVDEHLDRARSRIHSGSGSGPSGRVREYLRAWQRWRGSRDRRSPDWSRQT